MIDAVTAFDPLAEVQDAALGYGGSIWSAAQVVSANPLELLARVTGQEILSRATELAAETLADEMAVDAVLGGEGTGSEIFLEMPELGAVGFARVIAIEPCPEVIDGPGRVVTATFRHQSANVLDLAFAPVSGSNSETTTVAFNSSSDSRSAASSFSLGVTSVHPFWSVDREDFVPAGELRPFEQVLGIDGQHFRLTSITPRAGPETVYNFEVALDHVYYVGEGGLLVHNFYLVRLLETTKSEIRAAAETWAQRVKITRQGKNLAAATVEVNGQVRRIFAVNSKTQHSEEILEDIIRRLGKKHGNENVKIVEVFTERIPCGENWKNCSKTLNKLGLDFDQLFPVYWLKEHSRYKPGL